MCHLKQKPKRTALFAWVMMWWHDRVLWRTKNILVISVGVSCADVLSGGVERVLE